MFTAGVTAVGTCVCARSSYTVDAVAVVLIDVAALSLRGTRRGVTQKADDLCWLR